MKARKDKIKTLVTIYQSDLRELWFPASVVHQLQKVSAVEWVEKDRPFTADQLEQSIREYDAIITSWGAPKLTGQMLEKPYRLRFIGHVGGTLVPYLEPQIFDHGIQVANANEALARSTAELTVALMMAGAWNLQVFNADMKAGRWRPQSATAAGLYKQRVGLIGYGQVAREVIRMLRGFDCDVSLYSPYCDQAEADRLGVRLCSLQEVLGTNRIVSLHDTLTEETKGMIGKPELACLQDGALLVNTARAQIVQKSPLMDELRSGRISAALDVFHEEPLPPDSELLDLPNVFAVPHIGAVSAYWKANMGALVVEDLTRFVRGEPLLRPVTADKFLRMTEL